jgi:hypothetical protein
MNEIDILKRIISEGGNCCWARPNICANCPLSRLKIKPNGSYMSCIESLGVQNLNTEEEADAKYLDVATRLLLSEAIDAIIGGSSGSE